MTKLLKTGLLTVVGTSLVASSLMAGTALSKDAIADISKSNRILANPNITIKKGEEVSKGVTTLKLGIKYQTKRGISERSAQAFLVDVDGKQYTFLGGGYDDKGAKIALSVDAETINKGVAWEMGTGKEVLYVVTNPSCPWCQKFEKQAHEGDFLKKYTVKALVMPFNSFAKEKAYWVFAVEGAERADRYKKLMVDGDNSWKNFTPNADLKAKIDAELAASLSAAKELGAEGTPAVFDSRFVQVQNWPVLMK